MDFHALEISCYLFSIIKINNIAFVTSYEQAVPPKLGFCILAHVYRGMKNSQPHDHGPSWAVYSQVAGVTEMTDWRLVQKPQNGQPGKVEKVRTYKLTPGVAHVYNEGELHSPRRDGDTKLIRIEGRDLTKVKRDKFEIAA